MDTTRFVIASLDHSNQFSLLTEGTYRERHNQQSINHFKKSNNRKWGYFLMSVCCKQRNRFANVECVDANGSAIHHVTEISLINLSISWSIEINIFSYNGNHLNFFLLSLISNNRRAYSYAKTYFKEATCTCTHV